MCWLAGCRTIYAKLAGAFVDEVKDVYLQRCEEIAPNIRYCEYNIGDESAIQDLRAMRLKSGHEDALTSRLDVSCRRAPWKSRGGGHVFDIVVSVEKPQ